MVDADAEKPTGGATGDEPEGAIARIGTVVDKYTIVRILGRGGMGAVYEARHWKLARRVAIKFLLPDFAANREVLRRFENEAKAAGGLEHPNLAAVTDFGRADDGSPYLVMEFLEGEDCAKLLSRQGSLAASRAANIVVQACRGLAVAHKATIVHRDLKPENLFVTDAGDGSDLIKVLDFGIAKLRVADAGVVTGTGATFGTAYYMSPEQARGAGEVDPRTDVWSMGVVLYELLSGRKPFLGEQFLEVIHQILSFDPPPLATLRPDLPPKLVAAVESAMKKDLRERLPSVVSLAEALAPFVGARGAAESPRSAPAFEPTLATPGTNVGVGGPSLGARASVVEGEKSGVPATSAATSRGSLKVALAVGAVVVLAAVIVGLVRRPAEKNPSSGAPAPAASAAIDPSPKPPVDRSVGVAAPPTSPVTTARTASAPTVPPVVHPPSPGTPGPNPAPPGTSAGGVRTMSEHSRHSSNRHAAQTAPVPTPTAPPTTTAPNPAPRLETPARSRRMELDKEDPFGP
jgi:eukaryotic-like serine/threonine-protein kinase